MTGKVYDTEPSNLWFLREIEKNTLYYDAVNQGFWFVKRSSAFHG